MQFASRSEKLKKRKQSFTCTFLEYTKYSDDNHFGGHIGQRKKIKFLIGIKTVTEILQYL